MVPLQFGQRQPPENQGNFLGNARFLESHGPGEGEQSVGGHSGVGGQAQNWILTSTNSGSSFTAKSLTGTGHKDGYVFNIATTDGTNVFAMWLQLSGSVWNAMVAYSSNGGSSWSVTNIGPSDANTDVAIGSISSNGANGFAAWQHSSAIWFSYS